MVRLFFLFAWSFEQTLKWRQLISNISSQPPSDQILYVTSSSLRATILKAWLPYSAISKKIIWLCLISSCRTRKWQNPPGASCWPATGVWKSSAVTGGGSIPVPLHLPARPGSAVCFSLVFGSITLAQQRVRAQFYYVGSCSCIRVKNR